MGSSSSNEQQQQQQQPYDVSNNIEQQLPDEMDQSYDGGYGGYGGGYGYGRGGQQAHGYGLSRIPAATNDPNLSLVAVIVTIYESSSYDPLFRQVPQKSDDGRISVWECRPSRLADVLRKLKTGETQESDKPELGELIKEIQEVDPENVVFNWECCGTFSDNGFGSSSTVILELMDYLISKGYMLMFSDFAMKALIHDWNETTLGPKPFINAGVFSNDFDLKFKPATLKESPSVQLQKVGELCDSGNACVHAMSSTIVFTIDWNKADTNKYKLEVLTVATRLDGFDLNSMQNKCTIDEHKGAAGHVVIRYPSGGTILCSCGHWIELSKLDVNTTSLLSVAENRYGASFRSNIECELLSANAEDREEVVQKYARQFVQESAPCKTKQSKW
jgi:hypothetical protein